LCNAASISRRRRLWLSRTTGGCKEIPVQRRRPRKKASAVSQQATVTDDYGIAVNVPSVSIVKAKTALVYTSDA